MKKSIILTIVILFNFAMLFAGEVTINTAINVADNWLYFHSKNLENSWNQSQNPLIGDYKALVSGNDTLAYVFFVNPTGYILVAKFSEIVPVVAYSTTEQLETSGDYSFARVLKDDMLKRNKLVENYLSGKIVLDDSPNGTHAVEINRGKWNLWSLDAYTFANIYNDYIPCNIMDVGPLLESEWHQSEPYYDLCPVGNDGGQCVVGCVATATAQIMRYWQWPPSGNGSHTYYWRGDGSAPGCNLIGDFTDPYNWSNILLDYSEGYNDDQALAVAELCYEVGVGYEMDYHVGGSGAFTSHCVSVLPAYFRYANEIDQESRPDHTAESWFNMIKAELDLARPLLYRIYQTGWGGHAIVCDGWRNSGGENQLHFNYGWADGHNTWYSVDNLYPGSPENDRCYLGIVPAFEDDRSITLLSPNGGDTVFNGRTEHITWEFEGNVGDTVIIDLWKGGSFRCNLDTARNITWASCYIPTNLPEDSDYKVRISSLDNSVIDLSDANFLIIEPLPTELDTIRISNASQLQQIGSDDQHPRNGYYVLMNDIDAGVIPNWQPIGQDYQHYFRGTLDGQGFKVYDLQIDRRSQSYIGLFSVLMDNAVVKNLTVADDGIYGWGSVGALAGECAGTVVNCHAYIDDLESKGGDNTGGLIGEITNTGRIINCSVSSLNDGDVEADSTDTSPDYIGGFAGTNSGQIKWCWSDITVDGDRSDCEADGVSGLVGQNVGSIIECYVNNPLVDGHNQVGGIAGFHYSNGSISNCLDEARVISDYAAGGIAGETGGASTIDCCLANGFVQGGCPGALVGEHYATASNSFWNRDRTGIDQVTCNDGGTVINCHSINDTEAKLQATYTSQYSTNWDFSNVWAINNGVSYPRLRGIGPMLQSPTGLLASQDQSDGVHLSWSHRTYLVPNPGGDSLGPYNAVYRVFRSTIPNANPPETELTSGWQTGITFLDVTALSGTSYYYYIKAAATFNGARESGYSSYVQGQRIFESLSAPTSVYASDGLDNEIYIRCNNVPNANYYCAFRANSIGGTKTPLGNWQETPSFLDTPPLPDTIYYYWIKAAVDNSGGRESDYGGPDSGYYEVMVDVKDDEEYLIPDAFSIGQNYPNPFNASTIIEYALPQASDVSIKIYDVLGRKVKNLVNEYKQAGMHQAVFNASDLSSGIYFYRIEVGKFTESKKLLLVK